VVTVFDGMTWSFPAYRPFAYFPEVTVLEVIQRSSEFLARKGVESPRLQIELLLAHVLQMPRMKLYLNFERPLSEPEIERLRGLVKRRGEREPLQHIVGTTCFCGLELEVNGDVLIPRPETELLAEQATAFLSSLNPAPATVLDFGTGSGCLAITVAVKQPQAMVHALDVSEPALEVARRNAARHRVAERIQFHLGDGLAALPAGLSFDLLMANPPYIPGAEIATLEPEVRDHDPRLALEGGTDGLDCYRMLASGAAGWLKRGAKLMLELGDGQSAAVSGLLDQQGWVVEVVQKDYSGRERILIARRSD
jgi:release factor glutamine methyltransferase